MPASLRERLQSINKRLSLSEDWYLLFLAAVIGFAMGVVAVAFIWPIRLAEHWAENADPTLMRWLVLFVPALGALAAGTVIHLMGASSRGPGVSAVMYAVYREKSSVPLKTAIRKWIASTLTIVSGGSAGAEGPIVTIGSTIGSAVGRLLKANPQNTATLLGCGAAAGIAAVFNAPFAGVFFVMEVLLRDFSLRTFTPIIIASVTASAIAQSVFGEDAIFFIDRVAFNEFDHFSVTQIPNYLLLGVVCGIVAAMFIRTVYFAERNFKRLPVHPIVRPAIGGLALGVCGLGFLLLFSDGHSLPPFFSNGYPVITEMLNPAHYIETVDELPVLKPATLLLFLVALAVVKAIATCLTIASGGSGGFFAPSLMIGAATGGAIGYLVNMLGWLDSASPATYAMVGMAAVVAGTIHAPLTAILIVYEITQSYEVMLPLMFAAVISTVVGRLVYRESIYTVRLTELGVSTGSTSDLTVLRRLFVHDIDLSDAVTVRTTDSAQTLLELAERRHATDFVAVNSEGMYSGMVTNADLRSALVYRDAIPLLQVSELQRTDLPTVTPDETLDVVLDKFSRHEAQSLTVVSVLDRKRVIGVITRSRLMARYHLELSKS